MRRRVLSKVTWWTAALGAATLAAAGAVSACQPTRGAGAEPASATTNPPVAAAEGTVAAAAGTATTAESGIASAGGHGAVATAGSGAHGDAAGWLSWPEGSIVAASEQRPMMVFVYADWCPRCRELEPVLDRPEVRDAGCNKLVMVRQNQDEDSGWLRTTVGDNETYVPRVMFLNPDGTMRSEVSPHPRYPLFYTPSMVEALMTNMRAVAGC